jgi:tRNA(Ile)-lysidine synthase
VPKPRLRALHVDHGIQARSSEWERHCAIHAAALGVGYQMRKLELIRAPGVNLEAAARHARYAALAEILAPGEVLLTAHHADDQLETVLLRLMRGAGVRGMRGIEAKRRFGPGYLARPLLAVTRQTLRAQAQAERLVWIEDPSNRDIRLDRNYLRAHVLPPLLERWPAAAAQAGRTAQRMLEAEQLLLELAELDAPVALAGEGPVPQAAVLALSPARQRNLLRHLIRLRGLPLPNAVQLGELLARLRVERPDAQTLVRWPGAEARLHRGQLYLMPPLPAHDAQTTGQLHPDRAWVGSAGQLALVPDAGPATLADEWVQAGLLVRFRGGGERLRGAPGRHSESLKHWLQQAGIVPWMRDRIPLLYAGEELVAIGDLWVRSDGTAGPRWRVRWTDHPALS